MANKSIPGQQSKYWVFTAQNPTSILVFDKDEVTYAVYQREIAPTTGTEHYQGLILFEKRRRLGSVKSLLTKYGCPANSHCEVAKSVSNSRTYCMKEDSRKPGTDPIEFGVFNSTKYGSGTRSDLSECKELLDNGGKVSDLADSHFSQWLRYANGFTAYKRLKTADRSSPTKVVLFYGPTGTGKSWRARELAPGAYWKSRGKWWDGYEGHKEIVLDDLDGSWFPCSDLKRLLDGYAYLGEVKGSHIKLVPETIYITSNYLPWDWYRSSVDSDPVVRRIDEWWFFDRDLVRRCAGPDGLRDALFVR